ncbi:MAG: RIP metalloprotease RseP [Bacillota bacterium]|nr:RIP metalloprotease RseP [Bacillota bacterium]
MLNTIIASIVIFGLLIFVHELGHFLAARLVRIRVLEFAIGFGKELFGWEKKGTRFTLRLFPLGGFCRLLGEDPEDSHKKGSFQEKTLSSRLAVIAAGSVMNFLLAVVLFSLVYFFFWGVPQTQNTQIGEVLPQSRAYDAGLRDQDIIRSIDGVEMERWDNVVSYINANPENQITLLVEREKSEFVIPVVPVEENGRGLIGIAPVYEKYLFLSSIGLGFTYTWFFVKLIFLSLAQMITGDIPADVAGPVGIVAVIGEVTQTGVSNLFSLAAIISINLGIINLLPIPALDGSRLIFLALEGIRGKPIDSQKEGFIHFIGFTVLIMLMILIAFQDITRLFF